jgi:hypothetical protein
VYVNGGALTIATSTMGNNGETGGLGGLGSSGYGPDQGGGLYNGGTLTVSNSTLSDNTAIYNAGGIANYGTLTVSNSTLSGNTAGTGGGIYNAGTLTVSNSTLSGNYAKGIVNFHGQLTVSNSTVSNNSNIGIDNSGTLHAWNNIIAGNTFRDLIGNLGSLGHNLVGNSQGGSGFDPTDLLNVDPMLGPLQNNGGPTFTHALLASSPALNAGDPAQVGVADQRGVVRAGGVNIGAYQASASAFVVAVSGAIASGTPFDVTVQAVDLFGQVAFGYRGTVTFRVTDPDPAVVLPADYTFTADDQGTHTFTGEFTLITPGTWTLTTADLANGLSRDVMVTVDT